MCERRRSGSLLGRALLDVVSVLMGIECSPGRARVRETEEREPAGKSAALLDIEYLLFRQQFMRIVLCQICSYDTDTRLHLRDKPGHKIKNFFIFWF